MFKSKKSLYIEEEKLKKRKTEKRVPCLKQLGCCKRVQTEIMNLEQDFRDVTASRTIYVCFVEDMVFLLQMSTFLL